MDPIIIVYLAIIMRSFFFFYSPAANNKNDKLYVGYSLIDGNNNIVQSLEFELVFFVSLLL